MQEHELRDYQRLRAEGRWDDANEFREAERKRLRAAGRTRQQAREESWESMLERFPPLDEQTNEQTPVQPSASESDPRSESDSEDSDMMWQDEQYDEELRQLARQACELPIDIYRDMDFAYRNMSSPNVTPLMAPCLPAWQWYLFARSEPNEFLEMFTKFEEVRARTAGTISTQQMEDDKRKQFELIDKIMKELQFDLDSLIDDVMTKFPDDFLNACRRRHEETWNAYFAKHGI